MSHLTWLEINQQALFNNLHIISQNLEYPSMLDLRANAYGHGVGEIAGLLHTYFTSFTYIITQKEAALLREKSIFNFLYYKDWKSNNTFNSNLTQKIYGFHAPLLSLLTWKTRIISIKEIPKGTFIGYGCTVKAPHCMKIATLPIGYSDGYPRQLSHKSNVLLHNQLVPTVGIISMNFTSIDITHLNEVKIHDEVTLIGNYAGITPQEIAQKVPTIAAEITARINPLFTRVII